MKLRTRLFLEAFGIATVSLLMATVASIQLGTAAGLLMALGGALVLASVTSAGISRRVSTIAEAAKRYASGDLSSPNLRDQGNDEIGTVARVLDASMQELGLRVGELSRNRRLTDAILSSMTEGVLVVDVRGRVQMANTAVCEMLQIVKSPLNHHYAEIIRHPEVTKQITESLEEGGASRLEITLNTVPPKVCMASANPFVSQEEPGVVLVLHDVTDYRRNEQIRQDFVANVSHELRTPLTAIRGSVDTLLDDKTGEDRRFLEIIGRHTARMEHLVRDLLRLARLDAGQEALNLFPCSTTSLFAAVEAELEPLFEGKTQEIIGRVEPSAETLLADLPKLHDALKNLVENAVYYAPSDGSIELNAAVNHDEIVLTVGDRGPGIPEGDLSRVFERFYRVERSRARNPGGTGLGLAIVKHLVGLHGGTVGAVNRTGGGSMFIIRLPRIPVTEIDTDDTAQAPSSFPS